VATGGSNTTLVDSTINAPDDLFNNKMLHVRIGAVDYYRNIADFTAPGTFTVAALNTAVEEVAAHSQVIKAGGGECTITAKNKGTAENAYTVILQDGTEDGELTGAFADGVLTITSAYAESAAVTITAAALAALFTTDEALAALFTAAETTPGNLDTGATEYEFSGGVDAVAAIVVSAGDEYEVLL
jgi:hypothetical protein